MEELDAVQLLRFLVVARFLMGLDATAGTFERACCATWRWFHLRAGTWAASLEARRLGLASAREAREMTSAVTVEKSMMLIEKDSEGCVLRTVLSDQQRRAEGGEREVSAQGIFTTQSGRDKEV